MNDCLFVFSKYFFLIRNFFTILPCTYSKVPVPWYRFYQKVLFLKGVGGICFAVVLETSVPEPELEPEPVEPTLF